MRIGCGTVDLTGVAVKPPRTEHYRFLVNRLPDRATAADPSPRAVPWRDSTCATGAVCYEAAKSCYANPKRRSSRDCLPGRCGGEMAYRLAGRAGYERVRVRDEKHIAPGADTIRELFGGQPTLILLDEISVYLRKVERAFPDASKQFAAFIHDLFKAVASTPQVALVYTLAVGKDDKAGR